MEDLRPVLWSSAKSLGRKALRTGGKIMTEIADNPSQRGHILSQHATETTENIKKLRGGSRQRKRAASRKPPRKHRKAKRAKRAKITKRKSSSSSKKRKAAKTIKRDIFVIRVSHYRDHV